MEEEMRAHDIPLWALESGDPLSDFDFIGFTLQYELSYSNLLNMLELGNIPLLSKDRHDLKHIVVAGGPCACNPEPITDFIDIFFLGDGEEVDLEVMELYRECKKDGKSREEFLRLASQIKGVYVPALYDVSYHDDGTIESVISATPTVSLHQVVSQLTARSIVPLFGNTSPLANTRRRKPPKEMAKPAR